MIGLRRRFQIIKAVALVTYKEWSAYRTHSMVSIFVGPVYFVIQYLIWTAVYSDRSVLQGIDLRQMLIYFGATTLIGYMTMDFADWNLQMLVRTGRFLTFMLRPIHHRFFALSQKIGHRILGFLFEALPCLLIFQFLFRINLVPQRFGWTAISILFAFLMNFYVNYSIGLAAFWLTQSAGLRRVYQALAALFSGALVPLVLFPTFCQKILFFLPFQYVSYVPAMVWIGHYELAGITLSIPAIVALQAGAVTIAAMLSECLYRLSIRRYTDSGG
jgi:ABC-2 type transport system permease protein